MPVMPGDEACRAVRAAGFTLPIVAHTANADLAAAGFDDVLVKPYTEEHVDVILRRFVDAADEV